MECPNDLKELSMTSSEFDIINVVIAYTIEQYVNCFDPMGLSPDKVRTRSEARLLSHIAITYINASLKSGMCSKEVADWCIWRINNASQKYWGFQLQGGK